MLPQLGWLQFLNTLAFAFHCKPTRGGKLVGPQPIHPLRFRVLVQGFSGLWGSLLAVDDSEGFRRTVWVQFFGTRTRQTNSWT